MNSIHKKNDFNYFFSSKGRAKLMLFLGLSLAVALPLQAQASVAAPTASTGPATTSSTAQTPAVPAEPTPKATPPVATKSPSAAAQTLPNNHDVLKTITGLLFTLGLLFALLWVLKKTGMGTQSRGRGFYRIVASSSLGSREKICLMEVGDTWLVVGITAHSMSTLHTLPAGSISITGHSPLASEQFAKLLGHFKPKPNPKDSTS